MRWKNSFSLTRICIVSMWVLMLSACGGHGTRTAPPPSPDAELLKPCPEVLPDPRSSLLPDLLENHRESAKTYHQCRQKHLHLAEAVTPDETSATRWWQFWKIYW